MPYARDMDADLAGKFIGMYVNDYTRDYGDIGPRSRSRIFERRRTGGGYLEKHVPQSGVRRVTNWRTSSFLCRLVGRFVAGVLDERLHLFEFLLEPGDEIVRAVLEEHDEAEREKHKKNEPEKAAEQCHGVDGNLLASRGQRGRARSNFRLNAQAKLPSFPQPCACPCSI